MGVATQPLIPRVRPRHVLLVGPFVAGWSVGRGDPAPDAFFQHPPDPVPLELVETPAAAVAAPAPRLHPPARLALAGVASVPPFALAGHYNPIRIGY